MLGPAQNLTSWALVHALMRLHFESRTIKAETQIRQDVTSAIAG